MFTHKVELLVYLPDELIESMQELQIAAIPNVAHAEWTFFGNKESLEEFTSMHWEDTDIRIEPV